MTAHGLRHEIRQRKPVEPAAIEHADGLKRSIGTFSLATSGVGATIGTGIFFDAAAPEAGPAVVLSFAIAGIAAGLAAICYAEMPRPCRCRATLAPTRRQRSVRSSR